MKPMCRFHALHGFAACERGNALLDLGLVAMLLTGAVIGLLEYAAVTTQSSKLSNAARAAVEHAMKDPADTAGITNVAIRSGDLTSATLTVTVNQFCECPGSGTAACTDTCANGELSNAYVTVGLSQPAESFLQESGVMPDVTLQRTATMRMR